METDFVQDWPESCLVENSMGNKYREPGLVRHIPEIAQQLILGVSDQSRARRLFSSAGRGEGGSSRGDSEQKPERDAVIHFLAESVSPSPPPKRQRKELPIASLSPCRVTHQRIATEMLFSDYLQIDL